MNEFEFPTSKLANVSAQLEKLVAKNYYLHKSAREVRGLYSNSTLTLIQLYFNSTLNSNPTLL